MFTFNKFNFSVLLSVCVQSLIAYAFEAPNVQLYYGTVSGVYSQVYNITYYHKIPFGASTAGKNRYRAPQAPPFLGTQVYNTDQFFDVCPQNRYPGTEDCLNLGLYSRPWKSGAKRPVVVVFHGGAFGAGNASFSLPPFGYPTLNVTTDNDFVMVYPNYRLNAFGFLPGKALKDAPDADLNVGLLDQQAALVWVQNNIEKFGGNPQDVTIWGQSAGGGSVVAHTIANGGRTSPKLFSKAIASSPYWPKQRQYNDTVSEATYNKLVGLVGCTNASDTLYCLRSVDGAAIRNATISMGVGWAPVTDGTFIQELLSEATARRKLNTNLVFSFYNTHEGESFVTKTLSTVSSTPYNSTEAGFVAWVTAFLPDFTARELEQIKMLYPSSGVTETMSYNTTFARAGLIYRDTVLACPAYWLAAASRKSWLGEFTIGPALHVSQPFPLAMIYC